MTYFQKVNQTLRIPEVIVLQIEDKIMRGELKPDQMLPPEIELMKEFGVGRNTVREALRMLEASGLIKIKQGPRGGPVITKMTDEFVSDFLIKAIRLGTVSVRDLSEFRLALEPFIAETLALKNDINPDVFLQIENNISEVKALHKAGKTTAYENMGFHVLLATATNNPMFVIILKTIKSGFDLVTPPPDKEKWQSGIIETIKYHQSILDAIKNRNPVNAREQMLQHIIQIQKIYNSSYDIPIFKQ